MTFFSCIAIPAMLIPATAQDMPMFGVKVNPLSDDITENVRYVTYKCSDAKRIQINSYGEMSTEDKVIYMSVIYTDDGTVYMRDFLNGLYSNYGVFSVKNCWLVGQLSDDGRRIDMAVGQELTKGYDYGLGTNRFYPVALSNTEDGMKFEVEKDAGYVSIRIEEDGTLVAEDVDENHPWGVLDEFDSVQGANVCHRFVPTDEQPALPPPGLQKVDYDYKYYPVLSNNVHFGEIGKRLKVVQNGEEIYVQGCSFYHPEAWIMGHREGTSYVFKDRQLISAVEYFVSVDSHTEEDHHPSYTNFIEVITPLGEDVVFISSDFGEVLTSDMMFQIYGNPDIERKFDFEYIGLYGDEDIYAKSVFSKIPDSPRRPQTPEIKIDNYGGKNSTVTVCGSYFDTDGYVMDVEKMYYKLYVGGEPFVFSKDSCHGASYLTEPSEYLSYARMNMTLDMVNLPSNYRFSINLPSNQAETVEAELIYIQDGKEYSSSVGTLTEGGNSPEDESVYDLLGRKVSPDSLIHGIYIKGGKKFVVR